MEQLPIQEQAEMVSQEQAVLSRIHEAANAAGEVAKAGEQGAPFVQAAREEAEMKAAIVLAKKFPRDESASYTRIMRACDRPSFAEGANYAFPRGGQTVTGPSVDLARELARIWGNIRYGLRIVTEDDERVHIKGYAYDLESNTYVESEDKFAKLVQRRNKVTRQSEWVKPDERDLRELVNKRGAICVRNAILQLLPSDVIMDAMARCRDTVQKAAKGEIQQDREAAIRRLALAYHDIGVNSEMIAGYLKHPMELITNEEIADLRAIYKSIRDGNSRREEYFTLPTHGYGRGDEERDRSWSPRAEDPQRRYAPHAEQQNQRSSPPEPAMHRPQGRQQPYRRVEPRPQPVKRPANGLFHNQEPPKRQEQPRQAPTASTARQNAPWDNLPEMDLDQPPEPKKPAAQDRPSKEQEPRKAPNTAARQRPASNDPALQQARQNMEHVLGEARKQAPRPDARSAAGPNEDEESEPWQEVAEQAAHHWDTDDDRAVIRRLNRAAVALFQTPLKKLTSEQLARIMTQVNEGEITLN